MQKPNNILYHEVTEVVPVGQIISYCLIVTVTIVNECSIWTVSGHGAFVLSYLMLVISPFLTL